MKLIKNGHERMECIENEKRNEGLLHETLKNVGNRLLRRDSCKMCNKL